MSMQTQSKVIEQSQSEITKDQITLLNRVISSVVGSTTIENSIVTLSADKPLVFKADLLGRLAEAIEPMMIRLEMHLDADQAKERIVAANVDKIYTQVLPLIARQDPGSRLLIRDLIKLYAYTELKNKRGRVAL